MRNLIRDWLKNQKSIVYNQTSIDQIFLREEIWRFVKQSVFVHDSVFDFGSKAEFPSLGTLPPWKHVGQNDFIFFRINQSRLAPGKEIYLSVRRTCSQIAIKRP